MGGEVARLLSDLFQAKCHLFFGSENSFLPEPFIALPEDLNLKNLVFLPNKCFGGSGKS